MVGYHIHNPELLNTEYFCPHCLLLLRDAVQLFNCGHRLCQSCADEQEANVITCATCNVKTFRDNLKIDRGFKNDTQNLSITCALCNWTGTIKDYQEHLNHIHPNPTCDYCEQNFSSVNDLDQHLIYTCEKIIIYCQLKQFGCEEKVPRISLHEHYRSEQHQKALVNAVLHYKTFYHSKIFSQMDMDTSNTLENTRTQLQEISATANILSEGVETINDDLQRITTESIHHQHTLGTLTKDLSTVKTSIQEQNTLLDGIVNNQTTFKQNLIPIKQNLIDIRNNSHDGTFIWKITHIKEIFAAAQSETQTSIHSPPFYTSPNGYKMCLHLYPCGDGNARQTYMSLFFVLMRGEYDPILKFPFSYKVIFCLYDQTKQQNHIIAGFRPDIRSNSFQRPRSDMNIASGIPKFAPLTLFEDANNPYVLDDTMLIKVMIDFIDIPSAMLPYALSLNPGFTTSIQQAMIREESEKRQQQSSSFTSTTDAKTFLNIAAEMDNKPVDE